MDKKWFVLIIILLGVSGVAVYSAIWFSLPSSLPLSSQHNITCAQWGIAFDSSSVNRIYTNPESILENPAYFWQEDAAYGLVALAPWYRESEIPPSGWIRDIEMVQSVPSQNRGTERAMAGSVEIMGHADLYCGNALPVITSVLPQDADLETTVYLTTYNDPEAFAFRSNIVMDTGSRSHFGKTSKFFNILSHEIFHVGYFNHQPFQTELWPEDYTLHVVLVTLQNDGIAVFLQKDLSDLYPAPMEIDLLLLESKVAVRYLMTRVNHLLQDVDTLDEDESMAHAFSGLNQRALYVVGAHMARTIDEKLGREALAETVSRGPRSFIRVYNSVAEEGMDVHEIEDPVLLVPFQVLRKSAVEKDYVELERVLGGLREEGNMNSGGIEFEHLMSTGLVLQSQEQHDLAIEVFGLMVLLFPDHPSSHIYLGDVYAEMGWVKEAQEAYRRAQELDSRYSSVVPDFVYSNSSD